MSVYVAALPFSETTGCALIFGVIIGFALATYLIKR